MQIKSTFFLVFLFCATVLMGQKRSEEKILIDSLQDLRLKMINTQDPVQIRHYNDTFTHALEDFLYLKNSFETPLDSVPFIGDLYSPDGTFRIVNWNIPVDNGFYQYFAFIQTFDKKKSTTEVFQLQDKSDKYDRPEHKSMNAENWFGALYYQIIPYQVDKKQEYALLGWDGANPMLNIKLIEVLYFDRRGAPRFGATRFKLDRRLQRRVLFKYAEDASMSLRFHEKKKMIIFDHLVPMKEGMDGIYEFYGPDFTYDGFELKRNGEWEFVEDVDARQEKNGRQWNDPKRKNLPNKPK